MAEAVRFELTDPFEPLVFKTNALSRALPRFLIFGTQGRTRTDTILLLRETPHTNWATWALE